MDAIVAWATIGALFLNFVALLVAAGQLKAGRSGASAAALIALNEAFRQAWLQFTKADAEDAKQHAFADLMNQLELACAIFDDRLFVGSAADLLENYLRAVFRLIEQSEDARRRIQAMITTGTTFQHIVRFLAKHRDR